MKIKRWEAIVYNILGKEYIKAYILDMCRKGIKKVNLTLDSEFFDLNNRIYLINLNDAIKIKNRYIIFYDLGTIRNLERGDKTKEERIKNISFINKNDQIDGRRLKTLLSTNLLESIVSKRDIWYYLPSLISGLVLIFVLIGMM